ncbi:REST corepressor isoform X1 [Drosophila biarmipes]|uniref:REST corepressor isoform X1 n=1 Tax=Drosophila biarmipes TaxID=125945 RepID=UPI0007E74778|nr:REST corepressor isoform X1 [Drosophila biarmipes]XP_016949552.1 REST corepressor isoform X1 [Drosophila biarmipes]
MVLAERNTTDVVRNGRRSRGPSPNTHTTGGGVTNSANSLVGSGGGGGGGGNSGNSGNTGANEKSTTAVPGAGTPESSDDDNSTKRNGKSKAKQSEYEEKIRVGRDYQAVCPPLVPEVERRPEQMNERALLVWSPTKEIPDLKLEEYISVAKEKYGYNGEQALGMLFWHKHDLERAVMDLANFTPFPDEWTIEDKVLFEQAFQFHGKSFHRIRQMLPDKSIASLVKYYYSWKKTRHRSSAMDRQEKTIKAVVKDGSENGSEVGSNEESDNDDKKGHSNNSTTTITDATSNSTNNTATTTSTTNSPANTTANTTSNSNSHNSSSNNHSGNGNNNNGEENNQGGGSNSSNMSHNDLDTEPLSLLAGGNAPGGEEVLGFDGGPISGTNGSSNNGEIGGRVVVGGFCKICNVVCHVLHDSPLGRMCKSCHTHWRRTGNRRPISGPEGNAPRRSTHNCAAAADRSKRKPPKGMYINHDDLTALASSKNPCVYLAERDRKITALMAEIQKNRQLMEQLDKECESINVEDVVAKPAVGNTSEPAQPRISARWLPDEIQVALLALREYGKNFPMIAKLVTTKTEAHVRTFFVNNRRRYNLDQIVKEYEAGKSEESGPENEQSEPAADGAGAAAAAAASATASAPSAGDSTAALSATTARKQSTEAGNNGTVVVDPSQESLPRKEDHKKSELGTTAALKGGGGEATDTPPTVAASGSGGSSTASGGTVAGGPTTGNKSTSSATITITDESDTATNSSSDVVATGLAGATGSSSLSSASSASASKSQASSEEPPSALKSNPASAVVASGATSVAGASPAANPSSKRDGTALAIVEQPPAKKVALSGSTGGTEFLGK